MKMYNKYSEEMKGETAIYILELGRSITVASKESLFVFGICKSDKI